MYGQRESTSKKPQYVITKNPYLHITAPLPSNFQQVLLPTGYLPRFSEHRRLTATSRCAIHSSAARHGQPLYKEKTNKQHKHKPPSYRGTNQFIVFAAAASCTPRSINTTMSTHVSFFVSISCTIVLFNLFAEGTLFFGPAR
jgi:hypothetical protein